MSDDLFDSEDWQQFTEAVISDLVPKLKASAGTVSMMPTGGVPDVKFAVELGFSIMLDKPIIVVVDPGAKVPDKVVKLADAIVEGGPHDATFEARMKETLQRVIGVEL